MSTTATSTVLEYRWTTSRGRDTYGYNICTLYADGRKVARCNGGGYDMEGTCLGSYVAAFYADRLRALQPEDFPEMSDWDGEKRVSRGRMFYGLSFHDPHYDPGKAVVGADCDDRTLGGAEGKTVEQAEKEGSSLGLERYQAIYAASSRVPTDRHTIPSIDGACGRNCVEKIALAIGLTFEFIPTRKSRNSVWRMVDSR